MQSRNKRLFIAVGAVAAVTFAPLASAQDTGTGFMSDYSQLEKVTDGTADYRYLAPGAPDRMLQYDAIMIDQPEIFLAADSPYRGIKPKHFDALAESLRTGLSAALGDEIYVVEQAGENVLYLTVAVTNLKLSKVKKKAWQYVPVAFVASSVSGAASSDIAKKASFEGLVFELEAFDSVSGERIIALIDHLAPAAEGAESWTDVDAFMAAYGRLIGCRYANARLPEDNRADCLAEMRR